jgi:hypothetical protein
MENTIDFVLLGNGTEEQLRDYKMPFVRTQEDLDKVIATLAVRDHDYGTCAQAMSIAALATFTYLATKLGATSFQAGWAEMDFLRRARRYKFGFRVIDFENLLYPQYQNSIPGFWQYVEENKEVLGKEASRLLSTASIATDTVKLHWELLVNMARKAQEADGTGKA